MATETYLMRWKFDVIVDCNILLANLSARLNISPEVGMLHRIMLPESMNQDCLHLAEMMTHPRSLPVVGCLQQLVLSKAFRPPL